MRVWQVLNNTSTVCYWNWMFCSFTSSTSSSCFIFYTSLIINKHTYLLAWHSMCSKHLAVTSAIAIICSKEKLKTNTAELLYIKDNSGWFDDWLWKWECLHTSVYFLAFTFWGLWQHGPHIARRCQGTTFWILLLKKILVNSLVSTTGYTHYIKIFIHYNLWALQINY